jgi:hypothetical protein
VRGGAQDPIAIICGQAGMMSQFSYLPARLERRVPWPAEYVFVMAERRACDQDGQPSANTIKPPAMRALVRRGIGNRRHDKQLPRRSQRTRCSRSVEPRRARAVSAPDIGTSIPCRDSIKAKRWT